MKINFSKYNGAGNDFIIIDDRENNVHLTKSDIYNLCNRNIGIGGDGLIIIKKSTKTDFEILHYTSDGNLGSLCGNGSRCAILYAYRNNIINKHTVFEAFDGIHKAEIINDELIIFFMQGYLAAKDRLFQFEIWRRQATGTVSEIFGEDELERDIGTRLFKFRGIKDELNHYHEDGFEIVSSFVSGVNKYIEKVNANPDLLPIEFDILGIKPEAWTNEVVISRHLRTSWKY